jgi:hypothetical protein
VIATVFADTPHSFDGFKGTLTENYICQALAANGIAPFYWSSPGKDATVDCARIVPLCDLANSGLQRPSCARTPLAVS